MLETANSLGEGLLAAGNYPGRPWYWDSVQKCVDWSDWKSGFKLFRYCIFLGLSRVFCAFIRSE